MTAEEAKHNILALSRKLSRGLQEAGYPVHMAALALLVAHQAVDQQVKVDLVGEDLEEYLMFKDWFTQKVEQFEALQEAGVETSMPSAKAVSE